MKNDALFVRLDSFRDRCRDALDFTRTVIQFSKLERVEIGGTKGKASWLILAVRVGLSRGFHAPELVSFCGTLVTLRHVI